VAFRYYVMPDKRQVCGCVPRACARASARVLCICACADTAAQCAHDNAPTATTQRAHPATPHPPPPPTHTLRRSLSLRGASTRARR
jgi:hypothetical protein